MRIDRRLNLVLPLDTKSGEVYVHSTPISRPLFERHHRVIAKAVDRMVQDGTLRISGPRIAALTLRDVAMDTPARGGAMSEWDAPDGVELGLLAEIRRMTNVVMRTERGWETLPYDAAVRERRIDEDDAAEVELALCFFTCLSWIVRTGDQEGVMMAGIRMHFEALATSLNCTDYAASLPTSMPVASTATPPLRLPS